MFGQTIVEMEGKIVEFYGKEAELSERRAILGSAVAAESDAEMYLTDPAAAIAKLTSASLRAKTESDLCEAATASIRRRRCGLLAEATQKRVGAATEVCDAKQRRVTDLEARRTELQAELERVVAQSDVAARELTAAENTVTTARFGGSTGQRLDYLLGLVRDEDPLAGVVEAPTVSELCGKIEQLVALRAVPDLESVRVWAAAIEGIVERDRPGLLAARLEVVDSPLYRSQDYSSAATKTQVAVREGRIYRVEYNHGEIDRERSTLRFPDSAQGTGRSGAVYSLSGPVREPKQ